MRSLGRGGDLRTLVFSGDSPPHQNVGVANDSLGIEGVPPKNQGGMGTGAHVQHDRLVVMQQKGWCGVMGPVPEILTSLEVDERPGHLPGGPAPGGIFNARADELSQRCLADHEGQLHSFGVQGIFQHWGEPWLN